MRRPTTTLFLAIAFVVRLAGSAEAIVMSSAPLFDDGDGQLECHITNTATDPSRTVSLRSLGLFKAGGSGTVGNHDCGPLPATLSRQERCRVQSLGLCTVIPCYCRIEIKGPAKSAVRAVLMKRNASGAITAVVELRKKLP